jgi:pyruvate ferredoxin oxidoreductase beta subunit
LGRLAVETGVFPLYEVVDGRYRLTVDVPKMRPVKDYLKPQGRFRHLREPYVNFIQQQIQERYQLLLDKCEAQYPEFPSLATAEEGELWISKD